MITRWVGDTCVVVSMDRSSSNRWPMVTGQKIRFSTRRINGTEATVGTPEENYLKSNETR
ncbi:hypothetical protein [Spirosoma spitsbergense]|uniref:hypothetical protein n=1 Tax=Spirosoma spitsbergense TaxID=431554 RepID=UPI0003728CE3|nr:hypothetical protein [Spirosoma spitsbergense]